MKHAFSASAVFVLLLAGLPATAAEFDFLMNDIELLEEEIRNDELDEDQSELDWEYEEDQALFPEEEEDAEAAEAARIEENISRTHVFLRHNGLPVVLEDVPVSQWFAPYVRDIAERGIITGYKDAGGTPLGTFGPADPVTIEQLAKIAVESSDVDMSKCPSEPLNEAVRGTWSAPYMSCAEFLRWMAFSDAGVDPTRPASRLEVVATVLQAFNRDLERATGKIFKDVSASMPGRDFIETAAIDGIVSGFTDANGVPTGFFGPFDNVNRAETAKILSIAIQLYY